MGKMVNPSRNETISPSHFENKPLLNDKELRQLVIENMEADVVRTICREFNIPVGPVIESSWSFSGKRKPSVFGLNAAVSSQFPCHIDLLRPKKGHGQTFTLARLLKNPLGNKLILEFVSSIDEMEECPLLMVGMHPRIKEYVAVTNLEMKPAWRCISMVLGLNEAKKRVHEIVEEDEEESFYRITLATLPNLVRAMRKQGVWSP